MATTDECNRELNFITLIKEGLEARVKEQLTKDIVKEKLAEFEIQLKEQITPLIESITFNKINALRDNLKMRDELKIYISFKDIPTRSK